MIVMNKMFQKLIFTLAGLVIMSSPVFAGTKVGDIPIQNLDAALDLAKYTDDIIDITKVTKYGDASTGLSASAIKHGDDVFIKNADGGIKHVDEIEDLAQIDRAVKDIEASGFQFPCVVPSFAYNPINVLFPVAYASGSCVKRISDTKYDIDGKVYEVGDLTQEELKNFDISKFKQGKIYEQRISELYKTKNDDIFNKISNATGIPAQELKDLPHLTQVQVNLPGGGYVVLDDVFVKTVDNLDDTISYRFIVSDSKFSIDAPWTTNQGTLLDNVDAGGFSLRSKIFDDINSPIRLRQNIPIEFEKIVKTYGNGAEDIIELVK